MKTLVAFFILFTAAISAQNYLNNPESVEYYPPENCYLVSNWGDGNIIKIDSAGNQTLYDTTLTRLAALHRRGDTLYAAANLEPYKGIAAYDLSADTMFYFLDIPESNLLNDITSDENGTLYVTDYWDSKIFKVEPSAKSYTLLVESGIDMPNGIAYDKWNDRLITHANNEYGTPIKAVDPETGTVTKLFNSNLSGLDGVVFDENGSLFVSTWSNNSVYKFDSLLSLPPERFSQGHDAPADIFYNVHKQCIAVPNFNSNTLDIVPTVPASVGYNELVPEGIDLGNYPNPFNNQTIINYSIEKAALIELTIYSAIGEVVEEIPALYRQAGSYDIQWDASGHPSGTYICCLYADERMAVNKLVLIK